MSKIKPAVFFVLSAVLLTFQSCQWIIGADPGMPSSTSVPQLTCKIDSEYWEIETATGIYDVFDATEPNEFLSSLVVGGGDLNQEIAISVYDKDYVQKGSYEGALITVLDKSTGKVYTTSSATVKINYFDENSKVVSGTFFGTLKTEDNDIMKVSSGIFTNIAYMIDYESR